LIASVEQYSLKDIEKFTHFVRKADLREAARARKLVESALQLKELNKLPPGTLELVELYNEDDCLATAALHQWLEQERAKLVQRGEPISRPVVGDEPPNEKLLELERRSKLLFESLTQDLPDDREQWSDE